jgi:hypothetical protein
MNILKAEPCDEDGNLINDPIMAQLFGNVLDGLNNAKGKEICSECIETPNDSSDLGRFLWYIVFVTTTNIVGTQDDPMHSDDNDDEFSLAVKVFTTEWESQEAFDIAYDKMRQIVEKLRGDVTKYMEIQACYWNELSVKIAIFQISPGFTQEQISQLKDAHHAWLTMHDHNEVAFDTAIEMFNTSNNIFRQRQKRAAAENINALILEWKQLTEKMQDANTQAETARKKAVEHLAEYAATHVN